MMDVTSTNGWCRSNYHKNGKRRFGLLLAPLLFEDKEWLEPVELLSVVVPNKSETPAKQKASTQRTEENFPVQSFRTLLTNLAAIAKNRVQLALTG